jgi:hypothetical protein
MDKLYYVYFNTGSLAPMWVKKNESFAAKLNSIVGKDKQNEITSVELIKTSPSISKEVLDSLFNKPLNNN